MPETFVVIQYIPNTDIVNIYKIEAGNFDIAVNKAIDYLYNEYEAILLTRKQFEKLVKQINTFISGGF